MCRETEQPRTQTGTFHTRENRLKEQLQTPQWPSAQVEWFKEPKKHPGERLVRNLAVASSLAICAVALRQGAIPEIKGPADAVLTAASGDMLLDDTLGKLSFVSNLFPEATLVFGEQKTTLSIPVSAGSVVHAWTEAEPYLSWRSDSDVVKACASGEVIGVYHGNGDERLVQVLGEHAISCLYGNMGEVSVQTGDKVLAGEVLGTVLSGADCVLEVRQNGLNVDPALFLQ